MFIVALLYVISINDMLSPPFEFIMRKLFDNKNQPIFSEKYIFIVHEVCSPEIRNLLPSLDLLMDLKPNGC